MKLELLELEILLIFFMEACIHGEKEDDEILDIKTKSPGPKARKKMTKQLIFATARQIVSPIVITTFGYIFGKRYKHSKHSNSVDNSKIS